jgi:adenylyltransferase/sulfurtransferase
VGALQASQAIQLIGNRGSLRPQLIAFDLWRMRFRTIDLTQGKLLDCPCCSMQRFEFLSRPVSQEAGALCGRNAVQVRGVKTVNLGEIARRLESSAQIEASKYFVRGVLNGAEGIVLTVFADGRAIVQGLNDLGRARSIYSRFVGN